jgi:endonuclease YncB( thermonuclease family)
LFYGFEVQIMRATMGFMRVLCSVFWVTCFYRFVAEAPSVLPCQHRGGTYCGVTTGSGRIVGTVSSVRDGETLSVAGQSIRLDSIDAPALEQAYGHDSRDHLAALVQHKQVTVTYAKTDLYYRVVGTVFRPDCTQANLSQVRAGAALY